MSAVAIGSRVWDGRDLPRRRDELGVDDVQAVDRPLNVQLDVLVREHLHLVVLGTILELGIGRVRHDLAKSEVVDSALARHFQRRFRSLSLVVLIPGDRRSQHVSIVAAGQSPIAGQDQEQGAANRIAPDHQGVLHLLGRLAEVGNQLGDLRV